MRQGNFRKGRTFGNRTLLLVAALAAGSAAAATKHYSFVNGYPSTTQRQPSSATSATFGAGSGAQTTAKKKVEEMSLTGKVARVDSGDLVWVTPTGGRRTKVRLDRIDAPEQGQPFGVEAKKFLFDLVSGKDVTVRYLVRDRSGTIHGTVFLPHEQGLVDVNLTLIKNGMAWYRKAAKTAQPVQGSALAARDKTYSDAEKDAQRAKRGLWAAPNQVNPSEWRKVRQ